MALTMDDVATKAKVSKATVSRALRGNGGMSQTLAARVVKAADQLGYKPPERVKRRGKTITIMAGFTSSLKKHLTANPTTIDILYGIELEARERDMALTICSLGYDVAEVSPAEKRLPAELLNGQADGMVILGHPPLSLFEQLSQEKIAFVSVEAAMGHSQVNIVMPDHYTAGYLPTRYLLDLGHRRIAYIGSPREYVSICLQTVGYHNAMLEAGIPENEHRVILTDMQDYINLHLSQQVPERLLAATDRPTGLIFGNESHAAQAMRLLQDHGLVIPKDMSIIASSSSAMAICQSTRPRLTAVCCVSDELLGRSAVMRLHDILRKPDGQPTRKEVLPVKLVSGESTAPPCA